MDDNDRKIEPAGTSGGFMKLAGIDDGEYDALADLFLGDSELAPEPFSSTGTDSVDAGRPPVPVRLARPPIEVEVSREETQAKQPVKPHLAEQAVSRVEHAIESGLGSVPCIEAVLLGHLPVRASLWVRQYACSTARRKDEVVALIRAAAGSTSVDLIAGSQQIESRECASLHDALAVVDSIADRVILRVDETTEPELLDRDEIDEITILTGADETAIVASYRLIKTLTSVWDANEAIGTPHLRLAVMGATGQQVADASAKLTRAVDAFLDRPIEIIDAAGRIDATGTSNIYRDTVAHAVTSILDELIEIGCGVPALDFIESQTASESQLEITPETAQALDQLPAEIRPTAQQMTEPPVTIETAKPNNNLVSLIEGLELIETRCPFALDVELCVDEQGKLHLVADDDHRAPMGRLETVRAWVRAHLPLILRAEPKLAMPKSSDRESDIQLHLISDDPHTLRGLIDSPINLYALAHARVGRETIRVATRIN
jgi:hypothetical protein